MHKMSILYVEDDGLTRLMMKKQLKNIFESFDEAENGAIGLEKFKSNKPDIVVTDISMPVMNGYEMIKNIRAIDKDVKIVVTTAHTEHDGKLDGCIIVQKPILVEELIRSIT